MQYKHLLVFRHELQNKLEEKIKKLQLQQVGDDQMARSISSPLTLHARIKQNKYLPVLPLLAY